MKFPLRQGERGHRSIEELLGLGHDDFTRAVVLPQNSFQEFLMLDNAKKRDMLERIFYLEEYGRQLNEKLSRKVSALKSRIDRVEGALSMLGDASDQALEEAEKELTAAALERSRVEKELQQLEAQFNEAKEVWELVQSLEQIKDKEQQHHSHQEEISGKRIRLEKAAKAASSGISRKTGGCGKLAETEKGWMKSWPGCLFAADGRRPEGSLTAQERSRSENQSLWLSGPGSPMPWRKRDSRCEIKIGELVFLRRSSEQ